MRKSTAGWIAGLLVTSALVYWVASHTEWVDVTVPMPATGEAASNPFYGAQRFAEALGARAVRDRQLSIPSRDAVIVLSAWHWDLTEDRRYALERWVESGGRLVLAGPLAGGEDEFERWSGVTRKHHKQEITAGEAEPPCRALEEDDSATGSRGTSSTRHAVCDLEPGSFLETSRKAVWALRDRAGRQTVRVAVGRGSVTVINATPFTRRNILEADHGWLFVATTGLRRGDEVHFLTEDDHPSLLALMWRYGAPVIVLGLVAIGLALWRNGTRFGPPGEASQAGRRSLAEQIRGTGYFVLRHGDGDSLHAAAVRALTEAATRRIARYGQLSPAARTAALARLTGFDRDALFAAVHDAGLRRPAELRGTLAFLETARRGLLDRGPRRH